jgi:uncharacterized protein DUF5615
MRFLANENFLGTAVAAPIAAGHDVVWVRNAAPGMSDPDVLGWAIRDERTLLTFDKDFGELARARHAAHVISQYWDFPIDKIDWDAQTIRLLIEAVCDFAHKPLPSHNLKGGERGA